VLDLLGDSELFKFGSDTSDLRPSG
jgi:hypothetical protein